MNKTNIMIVGGFLGSGKTTSILSIAKYMQSEGKRIGIITNDHGSLATDVEFIKHKGLPVEVVSGGCFCRNLDQFEEKIKILQNKGKLDVILAEPVGSCTDLVATVIKPIKENKNDWGDYRMLPLSIIADPIFLKTEMDNKYKKMPNEVEYLIQKQIEEADAIVLNKTDYLCKAEISKLSEYLTDKYPKKKLIYISASQNIGIQEWIYEIQQMSMDNDSYANNNLNICYDQYAKAENEIGWMNLNFEFTVKERISAVTLITSLADHIKETIKISSNEIAHLKIFFFNNDASCLLSSTSVSGENSINQKLKNSINYGNLIINIRAYMKPEQIKDITHRTMDETFHKFEGSFQNVQIECFSPSNPKPVYRYL